MRGRPGGVVAWAKSNRGRGKEAVGEAVREATKGAEGKEREEVRKGKERKGRGTGLELKGRVEAERQRGKKGKT